MLTALIDIQSINRHPRPAIEREREKKKREKREEMNNKAQLENANRSRRKGRRVPSIITTYISANAFPLCSPFLLQWVVPGGGRRPGRGYFRNLLLVRHSSVMRTAAQRERRIRRTRRKRRRKKTAKSVLIGPCGLTRTCSTVVHISNC